MSAQKSLAIAPSIETIIAHNVQTQGNVGALFHLEPSHNPKAGEPAQVWFGLTKPGGAPIALSQCDCALQLSQAGKPIETLRLSARTAEQFRDTPASTVVFPSPGIYQLVITGKPKVQAEFTAFAFTYDVTVQPGKAAIEPAVTNPVGTATKTQPAEIFNLAIGLWAAIAVALIGSVIWLVRRR